MEDYDITLVETVHPDPNWLEFQKLTNPDWDTSYNPFESVIEVIYETTEETFNDHKPVLTADLLLVEIAGLLGLFMSWGAINVIDFVEFIHERYCKKKKV